MAHHDTPEPLGQPAWMGHDETMDQSIDSSPSGGSQRCVLHSPSSRFPVLLRSGLAVAYMYYVSYCSKAN